MDLSTHFRIWFSNNPEQFLPQFHQVTLEESISNNPSIKTQLIIANNLLSENAQQESLQWSEKSGCAILNIEAIKTEDKIDAIILEIVKQELLYWTKEPHTGNPGIASDYLRLLLANKGLYLDCDFFISSNFPLSIKILFGSIFNKMEFEDIRINNDIFCCNSNKEKILLSVIKEELVKNYFNIPEKEPIEINLENVSNVIELRSKIILDNKQILSAIKFEEFFQTYVTNLSGPFALELCLRKQGAFPQSYFDSVSETDCGKWTCEEFVNYLKPDAWEIHSCLKADSSLSWLPGNKINTAKNDPLRIEHYRKYLKYSNESIAKKDDNQQKPTDDPTSCRLF